MRSQRRERVWKRRRRENEKQTQPAKSSKMSHMDGQRSSRIIVGHFPWLTIAVRFSWFW